MPRINASAEKANTNDSVAEKSTRGVKLSARTINATGNTETVDSLSFVSSDFNMADSDNSMFTLCYDYIIPNILFFVKCFGQKNYLTCDEIYAII